MTNRSDKKLFRKLAKVIVPALFIALAIFFVNNWQSGLATKTDLLADYSKSSEIKAGYITIAQYSEYTGKIDATTEKVNEMHDDVKLMLLGMATMHPELRDIFLKSAKLPEKDDPKKKKKKKYYANGN